MHSQNSPASIVRLCLQIDAQLFEFIETRVLPGAGLSSADFWPAFDAIVGDLDLATLRISSQHLAN